MMLLVCCVTVLVGVVGAFADDLLACYEPVHLAYLVKEPKGGVDASLSPVLFLHAVYCSKEYWFDIPQAVADRTGRKVYVLDARDHGDSDHTSCFNFDVNAQDVIHFMDEMGAKRAVLVGHSIGGVTAIKVALGHPERVESAIIEEFFVKTVSSEVCHLLTEDVLLHEKAAQLVPHDYDEKAAIQFVVDYVEADPFTAMAKGANTVPVNETRYIALKRSSSGGYTLKTNVPTLTQAFSSPQTTMSDNRGVYDGPALFMYGTESPLNVFEDAANILDHFPSAQFLPVAGSNHDIHNNLPLEYTEYILKFMSQEASA